MFRRPKWFDVRWLGGLVTLVAALSSACRDDRLIEGLDAGDCCRTCVCRDAYVPPDAGADAHLDASGGMCRQGIPCLPDRGCPAGECLAENPFDLGGATDPISGLPGGGTSIPRTYWRGGYCTSNAFARVGQPLACDFDAPDGVDDGCGTCGQCAIAGRDASGTTLTLCLAACTPAATTNPCRAGYTCQFGLGGCMPGCGSDDECRVYRQDTNHNGLFDEGVDRLVYDTESTATCNAVTERCDQEAAPGATAGIACERDSQCEQDGVCLAEISSAWPGGYCTKLGCELDGRACDGADAVCAQLPSDRPRLPPGVGLQCLRGCALGEEPVTDRLGPAGHGLGCRSGYKCEWNAGSAVGEPLDGVCTPGNYNDVIFDNVGAACAATSATDDPDLQCYSPFGYGRCLTPELWGGMEALPPLPTGICSVLDCAAPGVDTAMPCGPDGQCVHVAGTLDLCLRNCVTASECPTGYACGETAGSAAPRACTPTCASDGDCTADRHCVIPAGHFVGRCALR